MSQKHHVMHGRDHLPDGADPIPSGAIGPIDSTENVGDTWGVHSNGAAGVYVSLVEGTTGLVHYWRMGAASGSQPDLVSTPYDLALISAGTAGTYDVTGALTNGEDDGAWRQNAGGTTTSEHFNSGSGHRASFSGGVFSIECWAWRDPSWASVGQAGGLVTKWESSAGWALNMVQDGRLQLMRNLTGGYSATGVSAGAWHHIVATSDGSTTKIYVDGSLFHTEANSSSLGTSTSLVGVRVARRATSPEEYFYGKIDEVALYTVALSAGEVAARYTAATTVGGLVSADWVLTADGAGGSLWLPASAATTDATLSTSDITTNDVTSTKHGFAPKSPADATKFLNGAATPAYALVKDSDLSTSDITTNNATTAKHGFLKKLSNVATEVMNGAGNWIGVVTSIKKTGAATLTGDVTLSAGSGVTLNQSGNDISISAASSGTGSDDGWLDDTAETWTYASGSGGGTATFTVSTDLTAKYTKGTRIKLTQTTVKYFVCIGSSHAAGTTTVTITAGTDYTLANAAISVNYHSYAENPQGYPDWFAYAPTATNGFSSALTVSSARFRVNGRTCTCQFNVSGTSNSTTEFGFNMPVTGATGAMGLVPGWCRLINNGSLLSQPGYCTANNSGSGGETSFKVYRDGASATWTASGTKAAAGAVVYEI